MATSRKRKVYVMKTPSGLTIQRSHADIVEYCMTRLLDTVEELVAELKRLK